jgi:hypothetical protein
MRLLLSVSACLLAGCSTQPAAEAPGNAVNRAAEAEVAVPMPAASPALPEADPSPTPRSTEDNRSRARMRCIDGSRMVANFDPDNRQVTLDLAGTRRTLRFQPGTSGIRYTGGGWTLEGKGERYTLTRPGLPPLPCAVNRR